MDATNYEFLADRELVRRIHLGNWHPDLDLILVADEEEPLHLPDHRTLATVKRILEARGIVFGKAPDGEA